jgi:hypothetical protein
VKVISLSEAQADLDHYGKLCREETVIVTIDDKPSFELLPVEEKDLAIHQLLDENPDLRDALIGRIE